MTCLSLVRLVPEPAGRIVGGRVLSQGEDLLHKSAAEMRRVRGKQIAMVLQDPMTSLNPGFDDGHPGGRGGALTPGPTRCALLRQRVLEALTRLRIPGAEARLRHYPHQLSGGMRQRVSSAIAMSCVPRLLIADEPTTSLDVTIQAQYLELLKEVQAQTGVAIILVTHDFGIVAANADRVAVMYAGRIVEMGSTLQVFDTPSHPYTQALLRCLPSVELTAPAAGRDRWTAPGPGAPAARLSLCATLSTASAHLSGNVPAPWWWSTGHVAHCWAATPVGA